MKRSRRHFWQLATRAFFAPLLAYFLAAQTILMPLARAKANEAAGIDAALGILCLTLDQTSDHDEGGQPKKHGHDLGCCLPGLRFAMDAPVAIIASVVDIVEPEAIITPVVFGQPQSRAPPATTATPSQSRAPPIPA
jgi:hypothetical protein